MYSTEQQKLVSSLIAKLRLAYPYYFKDLDEDMILGLVGMFNDSLCYYSPQCLNAAINSIIKESKFMPTIAEIIEKCDSCIGHFTHSVLEKMKNEGYFRTCGFLEATPEEESRRYDKACSFVERNIIPDWLLVDMKKYGYQEHKLSIGTDEDNLMLGESNLKMIGV